MKKQYNIVDETHFKYVLLSLATLDLEDSQVKYPKIDNKKQSYLFGNNNYNLYILHRRKLPESGPFEIIIENNEDEIIGFIRGNKSKNIISFNLTHIQKEYRGYKIGTNIYEKFLNNGFIIKSDNEITNSMYRLYDKLVIYGYTPIIFDDYTVGLKK